jgi:predicted Zn-dependent peptidase
MGLRGFSRFHPDRYTLGLLNVILGSNMSSRLFEEVREKRGLAYEIRSGASFYHDTGMLSISAGVEKSKAPKAVHVILRELEKFRKTKVSEGELRRAKDYFMSQLYMAIEDTLEHLLWVGERVLDGGEPPDHDKIRRSIESVTREDIQNVARRLFVNRGLNLALIGPLGEKVQNTIKKGFELNE